MSLAPIGDYHNTRSQPGGFEHLGHTAAGFLDALGEQELPDARTTAADRQFVKNLLAELVERLSVEALIFLAGGAEHAAQRKRAVEKGLRR